MTEKKSKDKNQDSERQTDTPFWEKIIAAAGLILVAGTIGFIIYRAVTGTAEPPNFVFKIESTKPRADGFLVEFELENTGDKTAAAVTVEGALKKGDENVEESTASLTYVPSYSKRKGGLIFTKNPQDFEMKLRVTGYETP